MIAYVVLGSLTAASLAGVLVCTRLLLRLRRPRFQGANFVVWASASIAFLVFWFPGFLVGGNFGGAVFSWAGEHATFFGIGLGIVLATGAPAILASWLAITLVMNRKEVLENVK